MIRPGHWILLRLASYVGVVFGSFISGAPVVADPMADYQVIVTDRALIPKVFYSTDSDRFQIRKTSVAWASLYEDPTHLLKWSVDWRRYRQDEWRLDSKQLGVSIRQEDAYGLGYQASLAVNDLNHAQILTTENRFGWRLSPQSVAEVLVLRDLVESQIGLMGERTYVMLGASLETQWNQRLSSVVYLDTRRFSDQNQRYTGKTKLIVDAWPSQGVTLQAWYQNLRNSDTEASQSAYFNPSRYEETLLVVGVRKRFRNHRLRFRMGAGTQQVVETGPSRAQFSDVILESSDAHDWVWRVTAGYRLSAGVNQDPNYRYRYGGIELIIPWSRRRL